MSSDGRKLQASRYRDGWTGGGGGRWRGEGWEERVDWRGRAIGGWGGEGGKEEGRGGERQWGGASK